jgi:hypothetical protein
MTDQTLKADGFDEAIIGINFNDEIPVIVYDKQKMIEILMEQGETLDDAIDYLEYNTWCSYVGKGTPLYIDTGSPEEVLDLLKNYG